MSNSLNEKPNAEELPESGTVGMILAGRYVPPPEDTDGKIWVRTSTVIQATPEELYRRWKDVGSIPAWQEQIIGVTRTGENTSHWVMKSISGTIEWDSEILMDEPGKRIAWRSIGGESENAGEVVFETTPSGDRGTVVIALQEFRMSKLTSAWETLTGRNPKQSVIENLRHFKALAEAGEIPRIQGQSHGPRGMVGEVKKSLYGEKVETPTGSNVKAS